MGDDSTTLRTTHDRLDELAYRSRDDDESYDDVIKRLLEKTEHPNSLYYVVEQAIEQYDDVASVRVSHPWNISDSDEKGTVIITVYTGEAETFEEHFEPLSPDNKVRLPRGPTMEETEPLRYECIATFDGPQTMDTDEQTVVYMDESVIGAEPVELEEGIEKLGDKLA